MSDESTIDVNIDIGKARLAYGWPYWGMAGSIDLAGQKLQRHIELRWLQNWLVSKLPVGVQLWIDRPLYHSTGLSSGERLTETVSAILTAQEWELAPIVIHSMSWKARTVGPPHADKDELRYWLAQNHPKLAAKCTTEDECDAMVIGLYGKGRTEGVILPPQGKKPARRKS